MQPVSTQSPYPTTTCCSPYRSTSTDTPDHIPTQLTNQHIPTKQARLEPEREKKKNHLLCTQDQVLAGVELGEERQGKK